MPPHAHFLFSAEDRFFKLKMQILTKVGTALCSSSPATALASEHIAEAKELTKDIAEILEDDWIESGRSARRPPYARMAEAVVERSFFTVRQNRIGLGDFLELVLRIRVIGIAVGMIRHRKFAIRTLDFNFGSRARDAQYLVIVAFCVGGQIASLNSCRS